MEPESHTLQRALRGDHAAYAHLVEAYKTPVFNLAFRMLGDANEAEEAAQETFLRAYTRLHTYEPTRKFSSWLLSIAAHYCIDQLRRRRMALTSLDDLPPWEEPPMPTDDPEEEAVHRESEREVQALLQRLPPDYRLAVVLRYWHDLSYEEIAEMTHSTVSAVKSRLHRAREMLAASLSSGSDAEPKPPHGRVGRKDQGKGVSGDAVRTRDRAHVALLG